MARLVDMVAMPQAKFKLHLETPAIPCEGWAHATDVLVTPGAYNGVVVWRGDPPLVCCQIVNIRKKIIAKNVFYPPNQRKRKR